MASMSCNGFRITEQRPLSAPLLFAIMRIPLKIVLIPVRIALSIFTGAANFILGSAIVNMAFNLVSGFLFLSFLGLTWSAVFVQTDMPLIARILMPGLALAMSYLASPSGGAIKFLGWMVRRMERINGYMKQI